MRWLALALGTLLGIFAGVADAAPSKARGLEVVLAPTAAWQPAHRDRVLRAAWTRGAVPLFSDTERQWLKSAKAPALAGALRVVLPGATEASELTEWLRSSRLGYAVEWPSFGTLALEGETGEGALGRKQWWRHNSGESQPYYRSNIEPVQLPGISGEDIFGGQADPEEIPSTRPALVAVLDTGVDTGHPDLTDRIFRKDSECQARKAFDSCMAEADKVPHTEPGWREKAEGMRKACRARFFVAGKPGQPTEGDTDGDGYPMDCEGWNIVAGVNAVNGVRGDFDVTDNQGHGTFVSGVIAAWSERLGLRGVTRNARILPVKVIDQGLQGPARPAAVVPAEDALPSPVEKENQWPTRNFSEIMARGFLYALRQGAHVIQISIHWPPSQESELLRQVVGLARARGVLVVTAAGNDDTATRVLPCHMTGVICVGGLNPDGKIAHFSNYGTAVDVAAPAVRILSTWPRSGRRTYFTEAYKGYEYNYGTSFSAPMVSGMLARLIAAGASTDDARRAVLLSARPAPDQAKAVLFGNADFIRAQAWLDPARRAEVAQSSTVVPANKDPIRIRWSGLAGTPMPVEIALQNLGDDLDDVEVALDSAGDLDLGRLAAAPSRFTFARWEKGATRTVALELQPRDTAISGSFELRFQGRARGLKARAFAVPVEISVPVGPALDPSVARSVPLPRDTGFAADAVYRTVRPTDPRFEGFEWLVFERADEEKVRLSLLKLDPSETSLRVAARGVHKIPADASFVRAERLDLDRDGKPDYVVLYNLPATVQQDIKPKLFVFLRGDLSPFPFRSEGEDDERHLLKFENNEVTAIPDFFAWAQIPDARQAAGGVLVPVFARHGRVPELERPAQSVWRDWTGEPSPDFHLYYLSPEGLRSFKTPQDDLSVVEVFAPSAEQTAQGELFVLQAKIAGDDDRFEYSVARLRGGALETVEPDLELPSYRTFSELHGILPTEPIATAGRREAPSIALVGVEGSDARTTILSLRPDGRLLEAQNWTHFAPAPLDAIKRVLGVFQSGVQEWSAMGLSLFKIWAENRSGVEKPEAVTEDRVGYDSQRRFSFIGAMARESVPVPLVVGIRKNGRWTPQPGLLVSGESSSSGLREVVTPELDSDGHVRGLSRPARFRLEGQPGCRAATDLLDPTAASPAQRVYVCADRLLLVPFLR